VVTDEENIAASVVNYMGYDAEAVGNHDVETGHAVYDKWIGEVQCPVLGANIIDTKTDRPYVKPYHIFVRDGVKIADIVIPASAERMENGFFNVEYAIPASLMKNEKGTMKTQYAVRLSASEGTLNPGLYYLRLMKK